ncbi:hypothetical protein [Streptomyces bikiniensis]|uniref:hypothetical protein n=1 Tax=Streptomyces bikiniensis TaxID=1896 RepID=UPI000524BA52|nr:hypothetical protein [Streptomyces bikiniensis]
MRQTLAGLALVGVTVACGPVAADDSPATPAPVPTSATPTPEPTPTPTPSPSTAEPTPSATTTAPPPTTEPPAPPKAKPTTRPPATPKATRAPKPTTQAPAPKRTTAAAEATCEIVSNAGNCYDAGQFCRKADLGRSTHAANRRMIHCVMDGDRARWKY